jgi:ribose transport system ATP-binding protein
MSEDPLLIMKDITKQFPGVHALDRVSFELRRGEVHALAGENGAGKSTLIKILGGALHMDEGEIYIDGRKVQITSPEISYRSGIAVIYQEGSVIPQLSVAENVFLGRFPIRAHFLLDWQALYASTAKLLGEVNFKPETTVSRLSITERVMVEVARALSYNPSIIVMDEASSVFTDRETKDLLAKIQMLKQMGVAVIYITHRLEEIFKVADRVTVLKDGRWVATENIENLNKEKLIHLMVGRDLSNSLPSRAEMPQRREILKVENLRRPGVLRDISFSLREGEILGIAGLQGSGRTELARAIFGVDNSEGKITFNGRSFKARSPVDSIKVGIALIPEDRKNQGIIGEMDIHDNIMVSNYKRHLTRLKLINRKKNHKIVGKYVNDLSIKTPSIDKLVKQLSGGNQQKVILARWLLTGAKLIIFDEPTRGIDVKTKQSIHLLIDQLSREGVAVIMISSELPEILGLSDRVAVMHQGQLAGILPREAASEEQIMHLATGGK